MRTRRYGKQQFSQLVRSQQGFTIVELMVAGLLGLILLAGVSQLFLGANQTNRLNSQINQVQDSGRFALQFMKEEVQRAGWSDPASGRIAHQLSQAVLFAGDNDESGAAALQGGAQNNLGGFTNALPSDVLVVQYDSTLDCAGAPVNGGATGLVVNAFFIQEAPDGTPSLFCQGNSGTAPQPLIENVESFQVLYGEVNSQNEVIYRTADEVVNREKIDRVRLALLVATSDDVLPAEARTFTLLDEAPVTKTDRRLRRVFTLTVPIRNVFKS